MKELRPVGTQFKIAYPPDQFSNDLSAKTITYKVIAHVPVSRSAHDEHSIMAEEVKAISVDISKRG